MSQQISGPQIYLSYVDDPAGKAVAGQLEAAFQQAGLSLLTPRNSLAYKDQISEYTRRLGQGSCVILVITDAFLRSESHMFELARIAENGDFARRVFPIVADDALSIYKAVDLLSYVGHWEKEIRELNGAMVKLDSLANLTSAQSELNRYTDIRNTMDRLVGVLRDMRVLSTRELEQDGLETLIQAVKVQLNPVAQTQTSDTVFLNLHLKTGKNLEATLHELKWTASDPLANKDLVKLLNQLAAIFSLPIETTSKGAPVPGQTGLCDYLQKTAHAVGLALTEALFSRQAQTRVREAIQRGKAGQTPVLRLTMGSENAEDWERVGRLLSLPWELAFPDEDGFPVREGLLDVVRETQPDLPCPGPPTETLTLLSCVSAPVDATPLDYEKESYRLWRALGERGQERRLMQTDLGTLADLAAMNTFHKPVAVHFTGHGAPGGLIFEDDAACAERVGAKELVRKLRPQLPRLLYLSSCYGASLKGSIQEAEAKQASRAWHEDALRPLAAELHRLGFNDVAAYLGPVGDALATATASAFYGELTRGLRSREAMRAARRVAMEPLRDGGRATHFYPLGWAQLHLYHRGGDYAPALPPEKALLPNMERDEVRRVEEKLDGENQIRGVQRLRFGFVGRREPRARLIRAWRGGLRVTVVHGLGGLGKTALCTEALPYLAKTMGDAPVLALNGRAAGAASDPEAHLLGQISQFGGRLIGQEPWGQIMGALERESLDHLAARAVMALCELQQGLLVYLDDAESLQLPPESGDRGVWKSNELAQFWKCLTENGDMNLGALASSRYIPEDLPAESRMALPVMRKEDMARLMRWFPTLSLLSGPDRLWLADRVDGHPRTLEYLEGLASKYIPQGGPYQGDNARKDLVEKAWPETTAKLDTDLALSRLWDAMDDAARHHLGRCAALAEPAPWELVRDLAQEPGTEAGLVRSGLLSPYQPPIGKTPWWAPHRLVAELVEARWDGEKREAWSLAGEWFLKRWEDEKDHIWADRAATLLAAAGMGNRAWAPTRILVIRLRDMARYGEALARLETVFEAGMDGEFLGNALIFKAQLNGFLGRRPKEAEVWLKEGIKRVGEEDRGFGYNEMGQYYRSTGQLKLAEEAHANEVAIQSKVKGEEHRDVASSLHALASVLQQQGDLDGARANLEHSLAIMEKVYRTDIHPDVAASLHVLAIVLQQQEDLDGARANLERSLAIKEKVFGTDIHPHVAASIHELAGVLHAQGDLDGARANLERSLAIKEKVFGTDMHPDVAASLNELAGVLQAQGELEEARKMMERVLEIETGLYGGRDHYSTAITETNLGQLMIKMGEQEEGVALLLHAYQTFLSQLGPQHPNTQYLAKLFEREG